jgi:hypothetical protein
MIVDMIPSCTWKKKTNGMNNTFLDNGFDTKDKILLNSWRCTTKGLRNLKCKVELIHVSSNVQVKGHGVRHVIQAMGYGQNDLTNMSCLCQDTCYLHLTWTWTHLQQIRSQKLSTKDIYKTNCNVNLQQWSSMIINIIL